MVSICIPTRNRAAFLKEAIKSVLAQSYEDLELIISDNASSDGTAETVKEFKDPRIRYFRNKKDIGMSANWNRCVSLSKGLYLNIFHDDDIMLPDNIKRKVVLFEKHPDVGIVHSNITRIDGEGKRLGRHWARNPCESYVRKGYEHFLLLLQENNNICASAAFIRKTCFDKAGLFDTRLGYAPDWEMWMRIMLFFDVGYIGEPLVLYRCHPGMLTEEYLRTKGLAEIYRAKKSVLEKCGKYISHVRKLKIDLEREYRKRAFELGSRYIRKKKYVEAMRSFVFGVLLI